MKRTSPAALPDPRSETGVHGSRQASALSHFDAPRDFEHIVETNPRPISSLETVSHPRRSARLMARAERCHSDDRSKEVSTADIYLPPLSIASETRPPLSLSEESSLLLFSQGTSGLRPSTAGRVAPDQDRHLKDHFLANDSHTQREVECPKAAAGKPVQGHGKVSATGRILQRIVICIAPNQTQCQPTLAPFHSPLSATGVLKL